MRRHPAVRDRDGTNSMRYEITRDAPVHPKEIEDLRESVGWDRSEGTYGEVLSRHYTHYTVRDRSDQLIAYMSVMSDGVADAFLLDLVVHPQFHHKGIGTGIVRRAITDMKAAGVQCVHVTFDDHLESFYRQCGMHMFKGGIVDFKNMKWEAGGQQGHED